MGQSHTDRPEQCGGSWGEKTADRCLDPKEGKQGEMGTEREQSQMETPSEEWGGTRKTEVTETRARDVRSPGKSGHRVGGEEWELPAGRGKGV